MLLNDESYQPDEILMDVDSEIVDEEWEYDTPELDFESPHVLKSGFEDLLEEVETREELFD